MHSLDLSAQIAALGTEQFVIHNPLSGPEDFKSSLNTHFNHAFGHAWSVPADLCDQALHDSLVHALAQAPALEHLRDVLRRAPAEPVEAAHCVHFYTVLVERLLSYSASTGCAPYDSCNLAQVLWADGACLTRRDCLLAAALLNASSLPAEKALVRAPAPPLELEDYLSMPALLRHLFAPTPGSDLVHALFEALGASLYFMGRRYRPPTALECAAGLEPDEHGKVWLPGVSLGCPPGQALDALLHSQAFDRWAQRLALSLEWPVTSADAPQYRALAEQALIDVLYPTEQRRAGYLLDFALFSADNAHGRLYEIRLDLTNSVQSSLGCLPALAELASELLMRRFAPELLLEGAPANYVFDADMHWTELRQGAMLLRSNRQAPRFEDAEPALRQALENADPAADEALRDTLAHWAALKGGLAQLPPWSARQWQLAYDRYLAAWDRESLLALPDRLALAREHLLRIGIDPAGSNIDRQLHLEAYLDHGAGYLHTSLPDATARFDADFKRWEARAEATYPQVMLRLLQHLPQDMQDRLADGPWSCHAVAWHAYQGSVEGGIPSLDSSPPQDWHTQTGTQGLLIHAPGDGSDLVCELFPERVLWRIYRIAPVADHWLAEKLNLDYQNFNDTERPWDVADSAVLIKLIDAPAQNCLQALTQVYTQSVALATRDSLYNLAKGATRSELALIARQQTSNGRYLLRLFSLIVPGLSCLNVQDGADAFSCIADAAGLAAGALVGGRKLARLSTRIRNHAKSAAEAPHALTAAVRRWSDAPLPAPVYQSQLGPRRWQSSPALIETSPWKNNLPTQYHLLPGQTPSVWRFESAPPGHLPLALQGGPLCIARDGTTIDAMVNGTAYRYSPYSPNGMARRLQHEPLLSSPVLTVEIPPYQEAFEASLSLNFAPPANDAGTAVFGQQASHAYQTVRIEPAPIRFRPQNTRFDTWAHIMVRDGKVLHYTRNAQRPLKALDDTQAQVRLGVISPPVYHRRIAVDPSPEFWFGLATDMPAAQVRLIGQYCPCVRVGGLARTIPDRRTLRGAVIRWRETDWLIIEADMGVFYGAPHRPWPWQEDLMTRLLAGASLPERLPRPPASARRYLQRITDHDAIEHFLEVSETYRLVATRPDLQRDLDNIVELLTDWIEQQRPFEPVQRNPFMVFLLASEKQRLQAYARNIMTRMPAQDALAGLTSQGTVGLSREIIPAWHRVATLNITQRQHIAGILNDLLPASGGKSAYVPLSAEALLSDASGAALREHLGAVNLAFAQVTLRDQRRIVYFALSGSGVRPIRVTTPTASAHPSIRYVDANLAMQGQVPDPRFTELSQLRRADFLSVRRHKRHLDSERLIASVLNKELLSSKEQVERIEVFTLLDACRSCGGFVLPRLRLDYLDAQFSVSWLLPYAE